MSAASLGSATGSRVDSSAKHTMACKTDGRFFRGALTQGGEYAENILHADKNKFCMQKDEIVMNTTKKFHNTCPGMQAYPLVITTLAEYATSPLMRVYLTDLYSKVFVHDFMTQVRNRDKDAIIAKLKHDYHTAFTDKDNEDFKKKIDYLPEFRCQGVALGQAFASHISGDTVATVLVGGMATVMNGHFDMFSGMLQMLSEHCGVCCSERCGVCF